MASSEERDLRARVQAMRAWAMSRIYYNQRERQTLDLYNPLDALKANAMDIESRALTAVLEQLGYKVKEES